METTIQLFNDSVQDVQTMTMSDFNQLSRREMVEVMYQSNEASFKQGFHDGTIYGAFHGFGITLLLVAGILILENSVIGKKFHELFKKQN